MTPSRPAKGLAPDPLFGPALSDSEFLLFRDLIHREAGIHLSDAKKTLVMGRLGKRVRELGLESFGAYYHHVASGAADERTRMLDAISTNETHFFREPRQFEILREEILPRWAREVEAGRRQKRIRVWSAACSTGEEPFSIAMALLGVFPPHSGWEIDILATDLSTRALGAAQGCVWSIEKSSEIPSEYLKAFMLHGTGPQAGKMKAGPELRSMVRFESLNLNKDAYPAAKFDLIFCRNVLIYFNQETKATIVERLLGCLSSDGFLFLGHAETLNSMDRVKSVGPNLYCLSGRGEVSVGRRLPLERMRASTEP